MEMRLKFWLWAIRYGMRRVDALTQGEYWVQTQDGMFLRGADATTHAQSIIQIAKGVRVATAREP